MAIERQSPLGEVDVTGVLLAVVIVVDARSVPTPVHSPIAWPAARPSAPTSNTPSAPTVTGELTVNSHPKVPPMATKELKPPVKSSTGPASAQVPTHRSSPVRAPGSLKRFT